MTKLIAIIRREYLARVRSKWFIVTTILAPTLLVGAMALPVLLVSRQSSDVMSVSVVDETGFITRELLRTEPFKEGRFRLMPSPKGEPEEARAMLRQRVLDDRLAGYLYIPADVLDGGHVEFWSRDASLSDVLASLRPAVNAAVRRVQAEEMGLDPEVADRLTRSVALDNFRLTEEGVTQERGQTVLTAHFLSLAIYMVVLLYGAMMLRAAVSEKATKTVEIILSSVRPWQLMLGKTLGVGAVGLTQVGVWLVILGMFLLYAGAAAVFADTEFLQNLPIGLDTLLLFLGLFITGYFLFGGMYASIGAIASTEQEASQLQIPVTILAIVPLLIIIVVLDRPTSTASTVLSWIPFFTPVLFMARYVLGAVAAWEIPLIFALQILAILFVAWVGGRIYRIGLLMTGKRPTLRELTRWVRYG